MCLSPSLFPLPPLSPTVLEPYLKAKRKTGFNTPARALVGASSAGAAHRPGAPFSPPPAPGGDSPKGSALRATRVSTALQPRGAPAHSVGFHAAACGAPWPCRETLAPGGAEQFNIPTPTAFAGSGVPAAAGAGERMAAALWLRWKRRNKDFPLGLRRFVFCAHSHARTTFLSEGNISQLHHVGIVNFLFVSFSPRQI